jgi:hypothetical protein
MKNEFENARPLNIQLWSDRPEVDAAVDAIFAEGGIRREHDRMKICLKVILLNLFTCYHSDPTRYIRYSRGHRTWLTRYNCLDLSAEQVKNAADRLIKLEYMTGILGKWSPDEKNRRQSRMRATEKLITRMKEFQVLPLMISLHPNAETIILKDEKKKIKEYEETEETHRMRAEIQTINDLLSNTLINLYMSDSDLHKLQERMRDGKEPEPQEHLLDGPDESEDEVEETPRGAIDFTMKSLMRVFNNSSFRHGGRLYGAWWQGVPNKSRKFRKFIRINNMNTVEVDFSAIHINLIYWLNGLTVPEGDLYTLDDFPGETRDVVKRSLLTLINADSKRQGMRSIREHINGVKVRTKFVNGKKKQEEKVIHKNDRIILPPGIKIEKIIKAFEKKHEAIKNWFFTGKGVELQYWDSQIAVEILLTLVKEGVPCLPLHDSFIVSEPQENGLRGVMSKAFHKVTGRYPKMDAKDSLTEENKERGEKAMEEHYQWKMDNGRFSDEFRKKWSIYVGSIGKWKKVTGKSNVFFYLKGKKFTKEIYESS